MHLSRLSLWWQSFSHSHFAKSPFELDGPHSTKRWQIYYYKNNIYSLQPPFGPNEPLSPKRVKLFYAVTMPSPLAGKVPCKGGRGIVKNNLFQKLLKLPAQNFTCFITAKDLGKFSSSMNFLGNYILKI